MVWWKQHVDSERGNRAHDIQPALTCLHRSACRCRHPRLTTGGAHRGGGSPDGRTERFIAVRKRKRVTWHQLLGIGTKLLRQCCYRGNNQRSVSLCICHIWVDQSRPDDLWHSLDFTTGGLLDQPLWDDFQRSFRTKILPVQSQNSYNIPAQVLCRKSVEKKKITRKFPLLPKYS